MRVKSATIEQIARGIALLGLGAWLEWRLLDNTLNYYIHPRFNLLICATGLIIIFMGGFRLLGFLVTTHRNGSGNKFSSWVGISLVMLLAMLGLFVTPQTINSNRPGLNTVNNLSTDTRNGQGNLTQVLAGQSWRDSTTQDTKQWNLLDWSVALNDPNRLEQLIGRPVDLTGSVIYSASRNKHTFMISRYVVVCCTADSSALRLPVLNTDSSVPELKEGQWVQIQGKLDKDTVSGTAVFVASTIKLVAIPSQPYIYP